VGRLSHPNIVTVYDVGDAEGQLYMAMELLEGDDLRSILERKVPISLPDRVRILQKICEGVAYAHSRGVVHRDIKPANILVTFDGRVKLLDFGLARVSARSTITRQGVILGTPDYMAPEQAMGKGTDRRSDAFSAGAVFYEFLSGSKPFRGKTLHSVLYQIISEEPEPLLTVNPDLPAQLAALVHGMLRKEPEKRYSSLEELGRVLQEIHHALRRSRSRSVMPQAPPAGDESRARVRDHLSRGRAHLEAGRSDAALEDMGEVLALDPGCEEAVELAWRANKAQWPDVPPAEPSDAGLEARVRGLLARAAWGRPPDEAKAALSELALIAPDEPRFADLLRERAARSR
jgi:serine/threonine protein kinase